MKQGLSETLLCWAFSSLPFCHVPFLTASLLSSQSPCWFIFNIYLSTFFFCPYLSPRSICFEIILKFWVKVCDLVTLGSRAMEEKQVGCLFVQRRLHLCVQPQHFFQCFCFAHSCCLLKISIYITEIYSFNLFFILSPESSLCCQEKWPHFLAGDGKFGLLPVAVKEGSDLNLLAKESSGVYWQPVSEFQ